MIPYQPGTLVRYLDQPFEVVEYVDHGNFLGGYYRVRCVLDGDVHAAPADALSKMTPLEAIAEEGEREE